MGEHVVLSEGRTVDLENDCLHYDFKDLTAWITSITGMRHGKLMIIWRH